MIATEVFLNEGTCLTMGALRSLSAGDVLEVYLGPVRLGNLLLEWDHLGRLSARMIDSGNYAGMVTAILLDTEGDALVPR